VDSQITYFSNFISHVRALFNQGIVTHKVIWKRIFATKNKWHHVDVSPCRLWKIDLATPGKCNEAFVKATRFGKDMANERSWDGEFYMTVLHLVLRLLRFAWPGCILRCFLLLFPSVS
jgi:hypothetical protein